MTVQLPRAINETIDQFSGRTWLLPILQDWLEEGDERIFLLAGEPGVGKSLIKK